MTASHALSRQEALAQLTAAGQPYELETMPHYGEPCRIFKNAPESLRALYEAARSDETFIVYQDERLSFEQTWQQAARLATLLAQHGVGKGDRVAISMRNYPEWILAFMAATSLGAIAVAMNALWQSDELAYGLTDSAPRAFLIDEERLERLKAVQDRDPEMAVFTVRADAEHPAWATPLERALESIPKEAPMPPAAIDPEDDATILYTSGSTGHPKGAVSCHRAILHALLSWELDGQAAALSAGLEIPVPERQPATLLAVPLFHATGTLAVYLSSYRAQRRLVSMYKWDVAEAARLIEGEQINTVVAPAAMTGDLVVYAEEHGADLSSLDYVGGGGAPRAPAQVKRIAQSFAKALPNTGWGMTETNAIGTGIAGQDYLDHPESSGRASAVLDLRVVDDAGNPLPPNTRGELQIRGTSLIRGYWNRPDANADTFVDGWLKTGDVAYLDDEGYLYIVDRIKDLVIRGGENIGCGAVEAALLEHPAVAEASVYGVPDERLGEEVGTTLYCTAETTEVELRDFLTPRLAKFEIPRYFTFAEAPLPRTASGKILKRELRDRAIAKPASKAT
jgi:long-chain acyl-CoA synthetase